MNRIQRNLMVVDFFKSDRRFVRIYMNFNFHILNVFGIDVSCLK